jgi:magnesium chelatase subunit D
VASVAVGATVRQAVARVAAAGRPAPGLSIVQPADLREAVREQKSANMIVFVVDASGSMGAPDRMAAARGAVLGLLRDAYQRRDLVALVAFRGETAEVLLRPTGSVEVARARLDDLPTGGRTPLATGIRAGLDLASAPARAESHRPLLVLVTDGRATSGAAGTDAVEAAAHAAAAVKRSGVDAVVIDVEGAGGAPRLGLAEELARQMGAEHHPISCVTSDALQAAVTRLTSR